MRVTRERDGLSKSLRVQKGGQSNAPGTPTVLIMVFHWAFWEGILAVDNIQGSIQKQEKDVRYLEGVVVG